jgi:molybdopterin synthase catalytic subunit
MLSHGREDCENALVTTNDRIRLIAVRATPLSIDEVVHAVTDAHAGAIALFLGVVRDHTPDRPGAEVTELEYTAHPTAHERLVSVAEKIAADYPEANLAAVHRTGELATGETAVVVAAAAAHRAEAFAACRALIDLLKQEVPIWKRELFRDGSHTWVGV